MPDAVKTYTHQEAYENTLNYFDGDTLCANVMVEKYLMRDDEGNFLEKNPDEAICRIASEFERIEKKYPNSLPREAILRLLGGFKYIIPQGSPLFGVGNNQQITSLSNCFVINSPEDSYSGVMKSDEELAQVMKRRGGVGIDISTLRPKGAVVNNAARTSAGVECFMERFSNTTKEVAQNGRRGALMLSIDCRHPAVEDFINVKRNKKKVTAANISVKWTDDFLRAVEENKDYVLRYPVDMDPDCAKFTKTVNARKVWENFIQANWEAAEPGCLFINTIKRYSLSDCYPDFPTISTNPCGELPLSPYGSCILMVINLSSFVKKPFEHDAEFDFVGFRDCAKKAMRLMDDLIDLEIEKIDKILLKLKSDPESEEVKKREIDMWENIRRTCINGRRTGLGTTGLADALAYCNHKYGSQVSIDLADKIFSTMNEAVFSESVQLAKERGKFPAFDWNMEKDCLILKTLPPALIKDMSLHGRRNISLTTMAPAGSISILAKITSGIEPMILRTYKRFRKLMQDEMDRGIKPDRVDSDGIKWTSYDVEHHGLKLWKQKHPGRSIKESPYWGCEAGELDWKVRVKMQAVVQKYVTHSISSTCNLASSVTPEQVGAMYMQAWKEGLKGFTIYRDGSREGVMVSEASQIPANITDHHAPKRLDILECDIHYSTIDGNQWIFIVGLLGKRPFEIFGGKRTKIDLPKKFKGGWLKKNGKIDGRRTYDLVLGTLEESDERMVIRDVTSSFSPAAGSYTRMISMSLRHGTPIKFVCEQLNKDNETNMFCFERGVSRILKKYIKDGEMATGTCEGCGGKLQYKDGCVICMSCGSSKCN